MRKDYNFLKSFLFTKGTKIQNQRSSSQQKLQIQIQNSIQQRMKRSIQQKIIRVMDNEIQGEQNSLDQNLNGRFAADNQQIDQEVQQIDYPRKIQNIHQMISKLNEEEEILKETLKFKEKQLLDTFKLLHQKKQKIRDLVLKATNQDQIQLDIGLSEEFSELKSIIEAQRKQIDQLKDQISKQGLSGRNNDQDFIRVYTKIPEMQKQIQIGRKFASTQFVRDYFDKPQVYKVAYEEVKYEFEIRSKIKESLQQQKLILNLKKEEIAKTITNEKSIEQELLKQKDNLLKQLKLIS